MKKGIIVGKMERSYQKGGEQRFYRELYVVWDKTNQPQEGVSGQLVDRVRVNFPVGNISLHDYCGFVYEPGFGGQAQVTDLQVLGHAELTVRFPEGV